MKTLLWVCANMLATVVSLSAQVKLAAPFGEHMVLQRDKPVAVFGTATAGEGVVVRFRNQEQRVVTDAEGKWKAILAPLPASGQPAELTVTAGTGAPLVIDDILVGHVWVCSGQSNMAMTAKELPPADAATALAAHPLIRLNNSADRSVWTACTADTAKDASALGVLFGECMLAASADKVPVGIVSRAVGGTEIQRWLDPLSCQADSEFASKNSAKTGKDLYRAQIEPLMPMAIRGCYGIRASKILSTERNSTRRACSTSCATGASSGARAIFLFSSCSCRTSTHPGRVSRWRVTRVEWTCARRNSSPRARCRGLR